ncbi:MAG: hypothetical protein ACO1PB_00835 [Ramlibacter sp.]
MPRLAAVLLAVAACAPLAHAGPRGAMPVSATVVNTCFFGQQARCHLPGTPLRMQVERAPEGAATTSGRRVVHL